MTITTLSDKAKAALAKAYCTRGKHRGQLLARCPRSDTLEAAASLSSCGSRYGD